MAGADRKRVEALVKNLESSKQEDDEDDPESKELEKIIEDKHANFAKISRHYKLFEHISRSDPGQVLRYIKGKAEPLWPSERNIPMPPPPCDKCGAQRQFEF